MRRRFFLTTLASGATLALLAGCGGGGGNSVVTDGAGLLRDVELSPLPGATFLPRDISFTLFWPRGTEPPARFNVRLLRLRSGGSDEVINTRLEQDGSAFTYFLTPVSNLDSNTAYYIELTATDQPTLRFSYIIGTELSRAAKTPTRAASLAAPAKAEHVVELQRP